MQQLASTKNKALEKAALSYARTGSAADKKKVVQAGEALVNHYAALYSDGAADEDLKQRGFEGLLKALKRFDPARQVAFSTYASHIIIGEIRHELRDRPCFKVPDWMKSLQAKIAGATDELAQENGTMPTLSQVAAKVNVAEEGIIEAMQAGLLSLEELDLSKVRRLRYESFKLPIEDVIALQISLEKIDRLQRQVVQMIYFEGLTQEEAAKRLGLNQRRVSRLLKRGLTDMRAFVTV